MRIPYFKSFIFGVYIFNFKRLRFFLIIFHSTLLDYRFFFVDKRIHEEVFHKNTYESRSLIGYSGISRFTQNTWVKAPKKSLHSIF